jgi:TIR domain
MTVDTPANEREHLDETIDVFVSYAHSDDEVPTGASSGWVTTLKNELQKVLRRRLGGRGARVWMDHELAAHEHVSEQLTRRVGAARTLLLIMSPGYQQSSWCQRELVHFAAQATARGREQSVFPVEIDEVDRNDWHPSLQSLTPLRFWERRSNDRAPRLAGFPMPKLDEDSLYWRNVTELAHLIAKRLKEDSAPETRPPSRRAKIVLAETTDDLDEQRQQVAIALRQRGDVVLLPAIDYPRASEGDFIASVRGDLHGTDMFVQLLGAYTGKKAPGSALSFPALQAREAQVALARDPALRLMQWCHPDLDLQSLADLAHREMLAGPHVARVGFEVFRASVLRAVDELSKAHACGVSTLIRQVPAVPFEHGPGDTLWVRDDQPAAGLSLYVQAAPEDRDSADRIADQLAAAGAHVHLSPEPDHGQSFMDSLLAQEAALGMCDGVLLLYGRSPGANISAAFQYAQRVFGLRRKGVWSAVLDLPPAQKQRHPVRSPNLMTVECREGFEPAKLAGFFDRLRLGADGTPGGIAGHA